MTHAETDDDAGVPRIDDVAFTELLRLDRHGPDDFSAMSVRYPWPRRLYGGQVVAQALRAAAHTVDADRPVHSLHAYFIRLGSPSEPVRLQVERVRDGRSFSTRSVTARQASGVILQLSASFQTPEEEVDVSTARVPADPPDVNDPSLTDRSWGGLLVRRTLPTRFGWAAHWMRLDVSLGEDPVAQACAFAFMTDAAPTTAARTLHPASTGTTDDHEGFVGASLDHAIWFHHPTAVEDWHWCEMSAHALSGGRGIVTGDVLRRDGTHVATIAQQVLLRKRTR